MSLRLNDWDAAGLRCYGSVRVNERFDLIGVWSNPDKKNKSLRDYVAESKRYLALHADKLNGESIIIGDFNSNEQWARSCGADAHHSLVQQLADHGLCSAYHHLSGEEPGAESEATFFMYRDAKRPYHIDYAFVHPSRLRQCYVDTSRDWQKLSDHRPVVLEIGE